MILASIVFSRMDALSARAGRVAVAEADRASSTKSRRC
jgi:hypothetical protein